jgi:integrase
MARQATGQATHWKRRDGTTGYGCRFRFKGKRYHELLGNSTDGMTARTAKIALADLMAAVRAGRWLPPEEREPEAVPTFGEVAAGWYNDLVHTGGRDGKGLSVRSQLDLREWRLNRWILPFFEDRYIDEIGVADVKRFRREAQQGGLSNASVNKQVATVRAIFESAIEDGHIDRSPLAGWRRWRLPTGRPDRTWIEHPRQVEALLDAAGKLDGRGRGLRYRRPLLATLVFAGPRIGEALDLCWQDVDLDGTRNGNVVALPVNGQTPTGTLHIRGTKTDNAARKVRLAPALRAELAALRAEIGDVSPERLVFATSTGNRFSESNIRNRILAPAIKIANERLAAAGHPPIMDGVTPHGCRRTFASMLAKRGEDPATMMQQLGHATAEFTFEVYARAGDADREAWEALWQGRSGQAEGKSEPEAGSGADEAEAV